jgi:hypothetical protein
MSEPGTVEARYRRRNGRSPLSSKLNPLGSKRGASFTLRMLKRTMLEVLSNQGGTAGTKLSRPFLWG